MTEDTGGPHSSVRVIGTRLSVSQAGRQLLGAGRDSTAFRVLMEFQSPIFTKASWVSPHSLSAAWYGSMAGRLQKVQGSDLQPNASPKTGFAKIITRGKVGRVTHYLVTTRPC